MDRPDGSDGVCGDHQFRVQDLDLDAEASMEATAGEGIGRDGVVFMCCNNP